MKAVEAMLFATLSADEELSTLAPGGVWRAVAPDDAQGAWIVFQQLSSDDTYTFASRAVTELLYQVKAIAPGESSAPAWAAAERVEEILTDGTMTLESGACLVIRRTQLVSLSEQDGGEQYQHAGGLYTIMIQE